jgi:hypothetical protein
MRIQATLICRSGIVASLRPEISHPGNIFLGKSCQDGIVKRYGNDRIAYERTAEKSAQAMFFLHSTV